VPDEAQNSGSVKLTRPRIRGPGAGRPRKTDAQHALDGTTSRAPRRPRAVGDRPIVVGEVPADLLTPRPWLHKYAKQFWDRNARDLAIAGRLTKKRLDAWTAICERWGEYERCCRGKNRAKVGSEDHKTLSKLAKEAYQQFLVGCLRFGIDPAGDVRLGMLDGSSVEGERPATALPTGAEEPDRLATWLKAHGA
jgi:phage terminase small subunit